MRLTVMPICSLYLLYLVSSSAQEASRARDGSQVTGGISGLVVDTGGDTPLPQVRVTILSGSRMANGNVVQSNSTKTIEAATDSTGRYTFTGIPAGPCVVNVTTRDNRFGSRGSLVLPDKTTQVPTIRLIPNGTIRGTVLLEDGPAIAGAHVLLVSQEYQAGHVQNLIRGFAISNARGEYEIKEAVPDRVYRVLAFLPAPTLDLAAHDTSDPATRVPVVSPSWFPNSRSPDSAATVRLRAKEVKEGVDIHLRRGTPYCLGGRVDAGEGKHSSLKLVLDDLAVTTGPSMALKPFEAVVPADGSISICGLVPGQYRLSVMNSDSVSTSSAGSPLYGRTEASITDRDITGVQIFAEPLTALPVQVVWGELPTDNVPEGRVSLRVLPLDRIPLPSETPFATTAVPSHSSLLLGQGAYSVSVLTALPALYVKDVVVDSKSVLNETLTVGSTGSTSEMRIVVGRDAGSVVVRVVDANGTPIGESNVALIPANETTDAVVASTMITGTTDDHGTFSVTNIAPGSYLAIANERPFEVTPEAMSILRQTSAIHSTKIVVNASSQASVSIVQLE